MINSWLIVQLFPEESAINTLYVPAGKLFLSSPAEGSSSHVTKIGATPPEILRWIYPSVSPKHDILLYTGSVSNNGASIISILTSSSQSCESITVTSYIPADRLVCSVPFPKLLQKIS